MATAEFLKFAGILSVALSQHRANAGDTEAQRVQPLGWEDPLEKEVAIHFSISARNIPQTEEPGGLQSIGAQRIRHD